tara:strand:+ start:77 stop:466 length:390 start_codon:yes stop_codon:yes gene_type:complete
MKINFQCIELNITDEEMGCTVTFSDSKSADDQFKSMEEIMKCNERYLLIQRTYPEEDDEKDYYYIESSESVTDFDPDEKMIVKLNGDRFEINWHGEQLGIGLNLDDQELANLIQIFKTRFKERITIMKR